MRLLRRRASRSPRLCTAWTRTMSTITTASHHVGHEALIAVADSKIAQAAAANGADHGRVAEQRHRCERETEDDAGSASG